jgi:VWFA-related protein
MTMKRAWRLAGYLSVLGSAAIMIPLHAQQAGEGASPKFRSSTDMVTIQASVRDTRGRALSGLRAEDFEVRDNGELRRIVSLRSDRQSPVSVAILVDFSGSMRLPASREMARFAYEAILIQLQEGRDEAALFTFDSALDVREGFTKEFASLRGALSDFRSFGTTALYDAAAAAAKEVAARSATHKALIILTDGIDTSSKLTPEQVSGIASSIDVPVCIVATGSPTDRQMLMERLTRSAYSETADLGDLADWTGGQLMFASSFEETATAVTNLVSDLRQQYVIAIEAANTREWRRLDVRVKKKSATVKARSGYFGG